MKNYKQYWKDLHDAHRLTARDFIDLAIVKAIKSKNEDKSTIVHLLLEKYFTPTSNKTKLANGSARFDVIRRIRDLQVYEQAYYAKWQRPNRTIFDINLDELFETTEEIELYNSLWKAIDPDALGKSYVYYFTAQDIPSITQGVQAGHVLFKLGTTLTKKKRVNPDNTFFQWIGVPNSNVLKEIEDKYSKTWKLIKFNESDLNNKLTAIAIEPISSFARGDLISYELLKF